MSLDKRLIYLQKEPGLYASFKLKVGTATPYAVEKAWNLPAPGQSLPRAYRESVGFQTMDDAMNNIKEQVVIFLAKQYKITEIGDENLRKALEKKPGKTKTEKTNA